MDVVEGGGAISFLPPLTEGEAGSFWDKAIADLAHRRILVARGRNRPHPGQRPAHSSLDAQSTAPRRHRQAAESTAMPGARAFGRALLQEAENQAKSPQPQHSSPSIHAAVTRQERSIAALAMLSAGVIPRYAQNADGSFHDTVIFYKEL